MDNRFLKNLPSSNCCLPSPSRRSGQSIAEVLVAVAVGVILVGAAASLILPSLKSNTQVTNVQEGTILAKGLLDNMKDYSEGSWNKLLTLSTGSLNTYYLQTGKSPFTVATGAESVPYDGIASGLVGWWKFDEGYGSSTIDSSGNNNSGTWTGTPTGTIGTYYVSGRVGQYAGAFDGTTDWVTFSNSSNQLMPTSNKPFTVALWADSNSTSSMIAGDESLVNNETYTVSGFRFALTNCTAVCRFEFWSSESGGTFDVPSPQAANLNTWYQVTATYNGNLASLYVNGSLVASSTGVYIGNTNNISVGGAIGGKAPWRGYLDDARIYNRALSQTEVTQIYKDQYQRYFYLNDGYRTASGTPTTNSGGGNTYDPSTKQIVVQYSWPGGSTQTLSTFLTRSENFVIDQTDWSGGLSASGTVATTSNSQFATSSNIDYGTTTGSFYIAIPGY